MKKRQRADSTASVIKAMADAASEDIAPPSHYKLTKSALPFWKGIIDARAKDEWSDVDLVVAAQLAQCQADISKEEAKLRIEGNILPSKLGTVMINPRATLLEHMARREMALMRTLRLGGRISGDARNDAKRRSIQKQSEQIRKELEEDDLLA